MSRMSIEGSAAVVCRQYLGRMFSSSIRRFATIFQADISAILLFPYEIQINARPEKDIIIFSESQPSLQALQPAKTPSTLVKCRQKALNDVFPHQSLVLFWVLRHSGLRGRDGVNKLAMEGSDHQFV